MRKLMWFAIGFGIACGLCAYGLPAGWVLPGIGICGALAAGAALLSRKGKSIRRAAMACLGCAVGLGWFLAFSAWYLFPVSALDGTEGEAVFTASDYGYETEYGGAVEGIVVLSGKPYPARVYFQEDREVSPGDTITGTFRFRATTPGSSNPSAYYQGKGVFLLAYQRGETEVQEAEAVPGWCSAAVLRARIKGILESCFPEDVESFTRALLLGDSSGLAYETDTAFKLSGIRHIIAVSGLHVSILYGLVSVVTGKKRFLTALLGLPVLVLFAAVAGFTPSVTRACIMVGLTMLAAVFQREYDPPTALAFACLVMLAGNPLTVTSVSFQLSAGCVAGILLFRKPIHGWLKGKFRKPGRVQGWFCTCVSVTLSAMSLTTPLSAYYFGTVSLIGVVTNLLTLWVVTLIFGGILLTCLLSLLSGTAAAAVGWAVAWPIRYVLAVAKTLAKFPLAAVYTRSAYIAAWLVFCYLLLAVFLLSKKRRPGILGCCAALGLCLALLASWAEPLTDGTRITVLDVGQGQCILLQSQGKTFLVDCGGDSDEAAADLAAETLLSHGISRLDGVILTHGDRDHAGGAEYLLTRVGTDRLFLPGTKETADSENVTVLRVGETVRLSFGTAELTIFGPVYNGSSNENSLCVLFDTENCDILITGDRSGFGERALLRTNALPEVDVLVAGHHGAEDSTCAELLEAVRPEVVLISVGEANIYGHPAPELLQRLEEFGCTVYRTDQCGTILYRG